MIQGLLTLGLGALSLIGGIAVCTWLGVWFMKLDGSEPDATAPLLGMCLIGGVLCILGATLEVGNIVMGRGS